MPIIQNDEKKKLKKRRVINVMLVTFALSIVFFTVVGAFVIDIFSPLQHGESHGFQRCAEQCLFSARQMLQ